MIGSICSEPKVLEIMRIVNNVILIIKILVPIMLIVSAMIRFTKVIVSHNDDELSKALQGLVKNGIAAVIIFLVPTFVNLIVNNVNKDSDYKNCLNVRTVEEINAVYEQREEKLISDAESSKKITDYAAAVNYLSNIKDGTKASEFRERLAAVKEEIDKKAKEDNKEPDYEDPSVAGSPGGRPPTTGDYGYPTDYGKSIPTTDEIRVACNYLFNQDTVMVHLNGCVQWPLENPAINLPGGGQFDGSKWTARQNIPLSQYRMGVFLGEIAPLDPSGSAFKETFAVMYTNVFLRSFVPSQVASGNINGLTPVITYNSGECAQVYKESLYQDYVAKGNYAHIIVPIIDKTRYYILVNREGKLIEVRYSTSSGILPVMRNADAAGADIQGILNAMQSGHNFAANYQGATLYDCRNLQSN